MQAAGCCRFPNTSFDCDIRGMNFRLAIIAVQAETENSKTHRSVNDHYIALIS